MLVGKELEMYQVQGKTVQIYLNDGSELVGMCMEFSSAYDNDPEAVSYTHLVVYKRQVQRPPSWFAE